MIDQRGLSLVELVVAALIASVVAAGLFSAYLAAVRSFRESDAQAALQRQGALALEEISRRIRGAISPGAISVVTCNGREDSVQVMTTAGPVCYYASAEGALCEFREFGGRQCRNLLAGGLETIVLLTQPDTPDPRCPSEVLPRAPCFAMKTYVPYLNRVDVAFAIRDSDGDLDGVNAMAFGITVTCSGRNC